jgi:crotonobetainyl-CoA:carnitine CoA-transferase CaiB-like acyl-CoA transferase
VLVSFKAGDAERLGLDFESVHELNSRAIYAEITAYGPGVDRTGYDAVIQAETGFAYLNGTPEGGPSKMPVALMHILAGHQLKQGILLALLDREQTGRGSKVSVSLVRSGLSALVNHGSNWLLVGVNPRRLGSGHPNIVPYGSVWETADGHHIVLAIGNDRQFGRLCAVLGIPDGCGRPSIRHESISRHPPGRTRSEPGQTNSHL